MSKNHDENKDIQLLKRNCYVNSGTKTIQAPKSAILGIKTWARIDFLVHHKGYHFIWDNGTIIDKSSYEDSDKKKNLRAAKKASREHTFANKNKRTFNKEK